MSDASKRVQAQPAAEASLLSGKAPYGTFLRDLLAMVRGRSDLGRELLCCSPLVLQRLLHSMQLAEYKTQALLVLCISLIRAGPRQDEQFVEVLLQPACLQQLAWALTDSNMQQQRLIARMLGMLAACCCAVPAHVGNIMHALLNADSRLPAGGAALEVARAVPGKLLQALLVDRLLVLRLVSVMEAGRQQWARWAMVWGEAARAAPPAAMQQLVLQLLPCSMAVRGGGSILWLLAADAAPLAVLQALLSSQQGVRAVVKVGGESVLLRLLGAAVAAGDKRLGCSLVRALAAVLADRDAGVVAMAERVLRASVHVLSSCAEVCGELVLCLLEAVVGGRGAAAAAACGVLQHAITASSRCRATLLASSQLGALCKTRHGISVLRTLAIRPSGQQALLPLMGRLLAAALRSEDSSAVAATMMLVEHIAHGSAGGRLMATQHVGELLQMALRQLPAVGRVCACSVLASLLSSHLASLLPHLDTLFEAAVHHPAALVKWWAGYVLGHMAVLSVEAKEFLADPGRMDLLAGLLLDGSATAMDRNHALSLVSSALAAAADLLAGAQSASLDAIDADAVTCLLLNMLARDATCTQQQHLRALRCIHKAVAAGVVPAAIDTIRACPFTASCLLAHLQRTWAGALAVWQHAAPLRHVGSGVAGGMPDHTVDATHAAVLLLPRLFERARQEMQCMVLALALATFFSDGVRQVLQLRRPAWATKRQLEDAFARLLTRQRDSKAEGFCRANKPTSVIQLLHELDPSTFMYNPAKHEPGFLAEWYVPSLLKVLGVKALHLDAIPTQGKPFWPAGGAYDLYLSNLTHTVHPEAIDSGRTIFKRPRMRLTNADREVSGDYDIVTVRVNESLTSLPGKHPVDTCIALDLLQELNLNDTKYAVDSMVLANYNEDACRLGHNIAGITCGGVRYMYNGWLLRDGRRHPCQLMEFDWMQDDATFCLNKTQCSLDRAPELEGWWSHGTLLQERMCYNVRKGDRVYFYVNKDLFVRARAGGKRGRAES